MTVETGAEKGAEKGAEALQQVSPLTFPLCGSQLIEASAGTGKTFTIAALYVRLVLGHGAAGQAFARALTPPEILVVTFTEAATKELRDRIRQRLAAAADYFRAGAEGGSDADGGVAADDFLRRLRAECAGQDWAAHAQRLQLASEWMDEAAVSTIHGWCNRMLREHAFDSGSLFSLKLESDQSELLAEVERDYWRSFIVPLDEDGAAEVAAWWDGPAALQASLADVLEHAGLLAPAAAPAPVLARSVTQRRALLAQLKAPWAGWVEELREVLDEARAHKAFDGTQLKKIHYDDWLNAIARWRDDPDALMPVLSPAGWRRLSVPALAEIWRLDAPPDHPALHALQALPDALATLTPPDGELLRHAAHWVAERFAREQQHRAQMGFNDLLTRLEATLHGPNGARLAERIRRQFPVALIDEFQDTDPVQYRIFNAVYRVRANDPDTALVLIGDPKQAIYSFRGADLYTYLAARRDCGERRHVLTRNFRSAHAAVAAVNRCFGLAEERAAAGEGAFLFRTPAGNPLPFIPASANGLAERLVIAGEAAPGLVAWHLAPRADGKATSRAEAMASLAAACASTITRLLTEAQAGTTGFSHADAAGGTRGDPSGGGAGQVAGELRPLHPRDLAVLVNSAAEALAIRTALAQRGLRSVYLSDRNSVFASPQAEELQRWLAACAEPDDARLLRAALATPTLALGWDELDRLGRDELAWEARVLQFRAYRELWRRQGVLPMLRHLLHDFDVPARLLGSGGMGESNKGEGASTGERVLTDLLHLAELLQRAAAMLDGEHALIRYLAQERSADTAGARGTGGDDARQVRLESDADLIQVVTVHKSKGLEYPLVFVPFASAYRAVEADDAPFKLHDDAGALQVLLHGDETVVAQADRERLGEDLRKLYVALTRARHTTWVGLAPIDAVERSAFGYLLGGGAPLAGAALAHSLRRLQDGCADIQVLPAPAPDPARFVTAGAAPARGKARTPQRAVREHWWVASYSALRTGAMIGAGGAEAALASAADSAPESAREDIFNEDRITMSPIPPVDPSLAAAPAALAQPAPGSLHAFPRGAEAGTFLHDVLEWAGEVGFAQLAGSPARLRDTLARRCAARGWDAWAAPLGDWAEHFLTTAFALPASSGQPATHFILAGLEQAVPEMEFWLAAGAVDTLVLDRLVRAHTLDAAARPALQPERLNGMLKGFIDLIFEHQGRFYVADYKSNWLGADDAAYTPAAMRTAILHSRYELQYVLYLLALHRLLKSRVPDYDYDRHVGGAVYLFLRGSRAPAQGLHFERPPKALIEALDRLFAGEGGAGDAAAGAGGLIEMHPGSEA